MNIFDDRNHSNNIQVFAFYLNLKILKNILVLRNSCTDLYLFLHDTINVQCKIHYNLVGS